MEKMIDLIIGMFIAGGLCAVAWLMTEIYYGFKEAYDRKKRRIENAHIRRHHD